MFKKIRSQDNRHFDWINKRLREHKIILQLN